MNKSSSATGLVQFLDAWVKWLPSGSRRVVGKDPRLDPLWSIKTMANSIRKGGHSNWKVHWKATCG